MALLCMTIRNAFAMCLKMPVRSLTAIVTLALSLGINIILFNGINALLWRHLDFPHAERLLSIRLMMPKNKLNIISGRDCAIIEEHLKEIEEIGITKKCDSLSLNMGDQSQAFILRSVNSGYIRALGINPLLGRLFSEEDDYIHSTEERAIVTEAAWKKRFGASPDMIGKRLMSEDGKPVRIIGVIPSKTTLPLIFDAELITAIPYRDSAFRFDGKHFDYSAFVRLKAGTPVLHASNALESAFKSVGNLTYRLEPLRQVLAPEQTRVFYLLYGASAILLLLATANVASLFLSSALRYTREMSIRQALGATPRQVFALYFMQSLLLCGAGLLLALFLNAQSYRVLLSLLPELQKVGPELLRPGWALMLFSVVLFLLVSLLVAFMPTWKARRVPLAAVLAQGGYTSTGKHGISDLLVALQMAIVLVLLTVGGVLGRSFMKSLTLDPGFRPKGVVCFEVDFPMANAGLAAHFDFMDCVKSLPGTHSATFAKGDPMGKKTHWRFPMTTPAGLPLEADVPMDCLPIGVSYFETLGATLKAGRTFTASEVANNEKVVILNASAAKALFSNGDAVGQRVRVGLWGGLGTVVGVVEDLRNQSLDQAPIRHFYLPYFQQFGSLMTVIVRTDLSPNRFESALQVRLKEAGQGLRMRSVKSLSQMAEESIHDRFRATSLIVCLALLALFIGVIGFYGTVSAQVASRRKEIGVRMALGANRWEIVKRMLQQGLSQVVFALSVGWVGAMVLVKIIASCLFGISPFDMISFVSASSILVLTSFITRLIPAWRAALGDPAQILSHNP